MQSITIPSYDLQTVSCDVCVVGGGTGGVVAALAAARQGAKIVLIEAKGYVGGTLVEGGTALHSFFNNYAVFGRPRVQLVKGIPQQILGRLVACGGSFGHVPLGEHCPRNQDSVCTSVDTKLYKLTAQQMLAQAGVVLMLETRLVGALTENGRICAVRVSTHDGEKAVLASAFIDCTGLRRFVRIRQRAVYKAQRLRRKQFHRCGRGQRTPVLQLYFKSRRAARYCRSNTGRRRPADHPAGWPAPETAAGFR